MQTIIIRNKKSVKKMKVEDSKIRIRKKNSSSVLEVKNDSSANDGTKVITVQKKLFSFIFLLQKELGIYHTTFYPMCISDQSHGFLMKTKYLPDTCFGLTQYQYDILKTQP